MTGNGSDRPDRSDREERLIRITNAICDGITIDWKAERERSPDLRPLLGRLELVERIRRAAREEQTES